MNSKQYYSSKGSYLKEHKKYFSHQQLKKDVDFLISALKLKKTDRILDLACGHGRHTIELKKKGFDIEGLDFSNHLLEIAEEQARQKNLKINFYKQDIHKINLQKKYDKIFLFFSEFGLFDAEKALKNTAKILKDNGLFLLDCDNVFRVVRYLTKHPRAPYQFDFIKMELKEKRKSGKGVRYYTFPELERFFNNNKLRVFSIYGNYEKEKLNINSKRMIIVGKKVKGFTGDSSTDSNSLGITRYAAQSNPSSSF